MARGADHRATKGVGSDFSPSVARGSRTLGTQQLPVRGSPLLPSRSSKQPTQTGGTRAKTWAGVQCQGAGRQRQRIAGLGHRAGVCNSIRPGCHKTSQALGEERGFKQFEFKRVKGRRRAFGENAKELARQGYKLRTAKRWGRCRSFETRSEIFPDSQAEVGEKGEGRRCCLSHFAGKSSFKQRSSTGALGITDCPEPGCQGQVEEEEPKVFEKLEQQHILRQLQRNRFYFLSETEWPRQSSGKHAGKEETNVSEAASLRAALREEHSGGDGSRGQAFPGSGLHPAHRVWKAEESAEVPLPVWNRPRDASERRVFKSSSTGDAVPSSPASGSHRFRLADSLVVDTCARPFRKKDLGRRCRQSAACDSLCAQHARIGSQHRQSRNWKAGRGDRKLGWKEQDQRQGQQEQGQGGGRCMSSQPEHAESHDRSAKSACREPILGSIRSSWGSFGRFLKLVNKSPSCNNYEGVGPKTSSSGGDSASSPSEGFALFPSLLVIPQCANKPKGARCRARRRGHSEAWEWVKVAWAFFTFLEGGQPFKAVDQAALVERARRVPWTCRHQEYAGYLHGEIHRFVRLQSDKESLSRGILKLSQLIKVVKVSQYNSNGPIDNPTNVAKNVSPSRMSLPDKAGIIDPCKFLKGEKLKTFKNMTQLVPMDFTPVQPVQGCFKVQEQDILQVYRRLLVSGVAALLPEELGVKDCQGNTITGGLFAVDHKPESDRIILDRRPFNEIERRLVWAKLPHGCLLTQLIVPKGWSVRGSGDDLSNYFYLLKQNDDWLPRNVVGKSFDGQGFEDFGGKAGQKYLLSFRVVAMGDLNAVDIAQQVHLEILRDCNCMQPGEVLAFKSPLPASHCYEGLYIDDHVVVQVLPNKKNRKRGTRFRDEVIMSDSRKQYDIQGVPVSKKKAFTKSSRFVAWGTEVDCPSGRVGAPLIKLRQLCSIICGFCKLKTASKKLTQQILGLLIHPLMHRRCIMCLLQECFSWVESLPEKGQKKIPVSVREELQWVALCLPLCHTDIRWPIANRIGCSE